MCKHAQGLHKIKEDGVPVLREASEQMFPSLIKKVFPIDQRL